MDRRDLRLALGLAALSCVLLLAFSLGLITPTLLHAAPVVLLVLPLVAGRYLGEDSIHRMAARRACRAPRRAEAEPTIRPGIGRRVFPRGGLLVASSLAERPPPASLLSI